MEKDQKISIVTGAGTGVGKSASLALADEGWTIVLAGRRKDPIEAVANEIKSRGGNALAIVTDTSDTKSVKGLFEETKRPLAAWIYYLIMREPMHQGYH